MLAHLAYLIDNSLNIRTSYINNKHSILMRFNAGKFKLVLTENTYPIVARTCNGANKTHRLICNIDMDDYNITCAYNIK